MASLEVSDDLVPSSTTVQPLSQGLFTLLCRLLERLSQRRRLQLALSFSDACQQCGGSCKPRLSRAFLAVLTN